jgi:hypothetical protein
LTLNEHQDHQQRGYAFERFLNELFEFEGLSPRGSFRIMGEQIDGSFAWANRTYLVEAKWVTEPVAGAEFGAFMYKIAGKTADTARAIHLDQRLLAASHPWSDREGRIAVCLH